MSFSKIALLLVSLIFASVLYAADDASSIKDEAQAKAGKISDVEAELNRTNSEASQSGDTKWKGCVGQQLSTVKNLVAGASNLVAKIVGLVASGKIAEAQGQLAMLNGLAESADKALAAAQTCERSNAQTQTKSEQQRLNARGTVSSAMNLNVGNDMPTEINRGAMEGSDSADAGGIDASGVIQTSNDASSAADVAPATTVETPEDAAQVEQLPEQEEQSPTR